jgi:hypothetical protein
VVRVRVHEEDRPAGLPDVITPPKSSTATHSLTDGQESVSASGRAVNPCAVTVYGGW